MITIALTIPANHLVNVTTDVSKDIGELSVIVYVLKTVENLIVPEEEASVIAVTLVIVDITVTQSVLHFVTEGNISKARAYVDVDAHREGLGTLVIKYAVQDVRTVHVIKKVGFVLVGA